MKFAKVRQRLVPHAIDEYKTFDNVYTTGEMEGCKIPATLADKEEVIEKVRIHYGTDRWVVVLNTLHLDQMWVSEDLAGVLPDHPPVNCSASRSSWPSSRGGTRSLSTPRACPLGVQIVPIRQISPQ